MRRARNPGRRPRTQTAAPHTYRQRHAAVERVNAELLGEARRARLCWDVDETDERRDRRRKSWARAGL